LGMASVTVSGTIPMKAAVLVPTPAIACTDEGISSTYTPGDKYVGIVHLFLSNPLWDNSTIW
jgi:hypothetical protein